MSSVVPAIGADVVATFPPVNPASADHTPDPVVTLGPPEFMRNENGAVAAPADPDRGPARMGSTPNRAAPATIAFLVNFRSFRSFRMPRVSAPERDTLTTNRGEHRRDHGAGTAGVRRSGDDLPRPAAPTRAHAPRAAPFRQAAVRRTERVSPRMVRVTLAGPELEGFATDLPAASVRVLLPSPGTTELVVPTWNGNEFLLPDGRRPTIRTFTPRRADPAAGELDLDVVDHGGGAASGWATDAAPGHRAAVSGPGRGYAVRADAPAYLLAGDETAIPALGQLLEALPAGADVQVLVEAAAPEARTALPEHPRAVVTWCDLPAGAAPGEALLAAVRAADLPADARVWVAGEAAGVQRIRRHLFEERGVPRAHASIRGYWKHGRAGDGDDDDVDAATRGGRTRGTGSR